MAKIVRKAQKIFAGSASNNGQFGSAQAGTKLLSTDPDVLQALTAWDQGWLDATISSNQLPTLEEMQGIQYVATRQIAYMFQEGISEWNEGTTYYQHSIVKKTGTYQLYGSKIDDNLNNLLTDTASWQLLIDLSVGVGLPIATAGGTVNAITANYTPDIALTDGLIVAFLASGANTSATVTFVPDGLASRNITARGGQPLNDGDIPGALAVMLVCYNLANTRWELLNPAGSSSGIGFMYAFAGASVPTGYLACNGAAVSRTTYAALFTAIGTTWGVGDGSTTFNVPDMTRRTFVGSGGTGTGVLGNAVGNTGGAETVTLSISQIPAHDHDMTLPNATVYQGGATTSGLHAPGTTSFGPTGSTGGGGSHANIQPSGVALMCVRYQ
jgi:microcystin-dependent protein